MEETKYYVNRWYDDRSSDNPYSFELLATDEYIGKVGDIIEDIEDTQTDFYFRAKDNLPITLVTNTDKNVIDVYYTRAYRQYMYKLAHNAITESLITKDIDVFLKLIGTIYGDLYTLSRNVDDAINVDYVDEEHLRHLCKLIGYEWVEALTAEEQRESIKFYMYLRRMRGTSFGLKNLIRLFGQTTKSLYQSSDNSGVRVMEYVENNKYGLYPGDIRIEIPEMSSILRNAAEDVKLMGTRLRFAYRIDIGTTNDDQYGHRLGYYPAPGVTGNIRIWVQPDLKGWDHKLDIDIDKDKSSKVIYKYRDTFNIHPSTSLRKYYSRPFTDLWMFQEQGLENVRGWLLDDGVIDEDLYLYK